MRSRLASLSLNAKVSLLGAGSVLAAAAVLVLLAVWQSGQYNRLAQREVDRLIDADLDHITQGVYNLVRTENEAVQDHLNYNLNVARTVLNAGGGPSLSRDAVTWNAVNQFTGAVARIELPQMTVGGRWLGQNADPAVETPVVDQIAKLVGETATVFQPMNERGDMLRVATNVQDSSGRRAIGTFVPAVLENGAPNPVIAAVLNNSAYRGRAFVVNDWYVTAYEPITDETGQVIGMLYVGVRQKNIEARVREAILNTKVGRTGYVYVLGGKGEERGRYVISQRGERDGENIWDNRDSDGGYVIQRIIGKAIALRPGELATERYRWQNPGEAEPRWKVARLAYYEPWDWVIGTSVYEDELQTYRSVLADGRGRMTGVMVVAGLAISLLLGLVGALIAWTIAHPVRQMTEAVRMIVDGNLERTVDVRSRDEIGVLAEAFNTMTGRLRETLQGLRESEANYRGIVENALEGLYRSSFEGRLLTANPAMARILGYDSPDELISTVTDIRRHLYVQPEDCDAVISTIRQFGKVEAREVQFRRKDGTVIWVSIGGRLVRDDAGRPLFIEGFLYDISVRKRAELALEESERRLTSAIQGSPVPTFVIDRDHRVIYWNQALAELSGFAAAEMVGTDRHWRAFYEAERPCMADLLLDGALDAIPRLYAGKFQQSGLIENAFEATDYFPQHRGGAGAWLRFTAAAIRDASGRAVGAIEILEDITEAKRAADLIAGLGALRARLFAAGGGVEKLRLITDGVVTVFRADFARIWLTRAGDLCDRGCLHAAATDDIHRCRDRRRCLHLVVSSGRYIHLDGGHRRVPLGCYKIGRVAAGDEPLFLTNDVTSDPRVHDHEWARGLGLVSFAGFRLLSEDGKPIGVLALFSKRTIAPHEAKLLEDLADTTTRVILAAVAEEALKESEQRFRAIFDNTTDGILLADIGSKTFFLGNRRICEMLGYAPEEIRALGIADIHPQAALPHVMEQFERQARKEIAVAADLPVKRKDGTVFYADIGSSPVVLGGRTFMIGVFRDATERKLAEEALRQSEQRFKQVAENAGEWIWEVDAEGVYRYCSAAVETILGYSPAELVGQKHYYDLFAPEVRAELMAGARAAFQRKEAFVKFVNPNVHKSGAVVILETTGSPVLDDQGNLLGYRGVDADVTERQRAEAEIRRLNAELEQRVVERTRQLEIANQELEAFSYSVSHDLRAPLRSVDGFSQALLEDYADRLDPQGRDYLQRARLASQRMARLIDDLLKLSRVSRSEMRRGPVDLAALARAVVAELRAAEPERQVEFVCPPQLMANADESLLRVALENLLGNAWKFTGRHPAAKVEFGVALAKREDGQVVYYVRDDGAGFDMAHAAKLFGPFQRMHSSAEFRGSGIGLATVQRIVRRHGGEVWAKAAVEQGATFYFTLPA